MRYTYEVQVLHDDGQRWFALGGMRNVSYAFADGFVFGWRESPGVARAIRIVRSDGKVVQHEPARTEVSLGMIAGWPSAKMYRDAAARALAKAEQIDNHARCVRELQDRVEEENAARDDEDAPTWIRAEATQDEEP